jgi:hypothetical protein
MDEIGFVLFIALCVAVLIFIAFRNRGEIVQGLQSNFSKIVAPVLLMGGLGVYVVYQYLYELLVGNRQSRVQMSLVILATAVHVLPITYFRRSQSSSSKPEDVVVRLAKLHLLFFALVSSWAWLVLAIVYPVASVIWVVLTWILVKIFWPSTLAFIQKWSVSGIAEMLSTFLVAIVNLGITAVAFTLCIGWPIVAAVALAITLLLLAYVLLVLRLVHVNYDIAGVGPQIRDSAPAWPWIAGIALYLRLLVTLAMIGTPWVGKSDLLIVSYFWIGIILPIIGVLHLYNVLTLKLWRVVAISTLTIGSWGLVTKAFELAKKLQPDSVVWTKSLEPWNNICYVIVIVVGLHGLLSYAVTWNDPDTHLRESRAVHEPDARPVSQKAKEAMRRGRSGFVGLQPSLRPYFFTAVFVALLILSQMIGP